MNRAEIDRLLARYSSGEITPSERDALFAAALDDQALFEELYQEDTLREALADPLVREHAALPDPSTGRAASAEKAGVPAGGFFSPFLRWRWPVLAAVAASLVIAVVVFRRPAEEPVQLAQNVRPAAEEAPAPAAPAPGASAQISQQGSPAVKEDAAPSTLSKDRDAAPRAQGIAGSIPGGAAPGRIGSIAAPAPESKGVIGGTPGGVIGGIVGPAGGRPAAPPPAPAFARQSDAAAAGAGREDARLARAAPASAELRKAEASAEAERARADAPAASDLRAANAVQPAREADKVQLERGGSQVNPVSVSGLTVAMRDEAAEPLTLTLSASTAGNEWRTVRGLESLSRSVPLRLTVRSSIAGRLSFEPAFTAPVVMAPGQSRTFDLPIQQPGERTIRAILTPAAVATQTGFRLTPAESSATQTLAAGSGEDQSSRAKTATAGAKSTEAATSSAKPSEPARGAAPLIAREIKFRIR